MNHVDKAVELYGQGFYCSQAVFAAFAEELGLDEKQALKVGSCFGGGMCKGEVCGACTGALMVLGMKYGRYIADDWDVQTKANDMALKFLEQFGEENGSYICNELLGCDIAAPEGKAYAREHRLFSELCPKLVESAAKIAERLIE
ncbi:MAG: C_GCAxxG_C_C family protein [Oscillospiraceae bacterium]|nr:C_GCAxxG_C_C family protein [Oscillospiraceae bacterium]